MTEASEVSTPSSVSQHLVAPDVSVVIPALNCAQQLRTCLTHLRTSTECQFEIIVVDDGSTDDTSLVASEMLAHVVRLDHTMGPAVARNRGVAKARGEIIVFLDADVYVTSDTLSELSETLQTNCYKAVFGSYDTEPAARNLISQYKNLLHHFTHQHALRNAATFWSGCGAVRRTYFIANGGYDETFRRPCIEDIEMGTRWVSQGATICLNSDVQVKHAKHWTLWKLVRVDVLDRALPWTQLTLSRGEMPNDLNLKLSQRLCVMLVVATMLFLLIASNREPASLLLPVGTTLILWATDTMSLRFSRVALPLGCVAMGLLLIALGWLAPIATFAAFVSLVFIIGLNSQLFQFFMRRRGPAFVALAVLLQTMYYVYSGLAFLAGCAAHMMRKTRIAPDLGGGLRFKETQ